MRMYERKEQLHPGRNFLQLSDFKGFSSADFASDSNLLSWGYLGYLQACGLIVQRINRLSLQSTSG